MGFKATKVDEAKTKTPLKTNILNKYTLFCEC